MVKVSLGFLIAWLLFSWVPARADGKDLRGPPQVVNLLEPAAKLLSGRPGLMLEGMDPLVWRDMIATGRRDREKGLFSWLGLANLQAPGAGGLVPYRSPAPAFSRDLLVTRDLGRLPFQTEPHLAVNPNNPDHLVLGVIDYNYPSLVSYVSQDGGATWEGPFPTPYPVEDLGSAGDPTVAFDRQGNVYHSGISIDVEEYSIGPILLVAQVSSIVVANSGDGGYTWPQTVPTARSRLVTKDLTQDVAGRTRGKIAMSFFDKPWMSVGPNYRDPSRDVLYVTFTDFTLEYEIRWIGELPFLSDPLMMTTIRLVRSEDDGRTWSPMVAVSPTVRRVSGQVEGPAEAPAEVAGLKRVVQGAQPVVDPQGALYVAWFDSTDDDTMEGLGEIYVARSEDGGKTFQTPVRAAAFNELSFCSRTASFRNWASTFPQIASGPQGELYLAFAARPSDKPRDDGDIYFTRSLDGGKTWGRPVRLNGDEGHRLQFFPALAVDPKGDLHAMWGDMRDDPSEVRYHIYYTRSEDQGETWGFEIKELGLKERDGRVSDFPSNPNMGFTLGLFIGDYFSIQATDKDVYLVWADTRLGEYGGLNQKIAFARRRAVTAPEVFLSPPAGPGGQEVTLQGFNFQPDMNIYIRVGGVLVSTQRTNREGRFTAQTFIPISGKGGHQVDVFDDSGNWATGSFFMEFGFDTIQEQQKEMSQQLKDLAGQPSGSSQTPARSGGCNNPALAFSSAGGEGSGGSTGAWLTSIALFAGALGASALALGLRRRFRGR